MNRGVLFKKELIKIVKIFLGIRDLYIRDNPSCYKKREVFKQYLKDFSNKYPLVDVVLQGEDLTLDDLKIFLVGYKTKAEILRKFDMRELPIMLIKRNDRLLVLINYQKIESQINPELDFFCSLASEKVRDIKLELPAELKYLSSSIKGEVSNTKWTKY